MKLIFDLETDTPEAILAVIGRLYPSPATPVTSHPTDPVPVTVASRPTAAVPTPITVDRDTAGLPWDERIHSSNKQLTEDGKWRKRRGVDDATVAAVTAELRGAAPAPQPPAAPTIEPPPPPPVPAVAPQAPAAWSPPADWLPHPQAPGHWYRGQEVKSEEQLRAMDAPTPAPSVTWAQICEVMQQGFQNGKCNPEKLLQIAADQGVSVFAMLSNHPDKWPAVHAQLSA